MGIEAELSLTAFDRNGLALPIGVALESFFDAASETFPCIPRRDDCDVFLANGMRLYRDCGGHPEVASPETTDPAQAVRYAAAMRQVLADIVREVEERHDNVGEFFLTGCNINYANTRATMGRHESYSHEELPAGITLREELVPFLASRVIFHGAGGLDPANGGVHFLVSPRAIFIRHEVSCESTADRGLLHTKDEPLAGNGYHRLHLIVGEYQCCQLGMWLTMGTTAIVLSLAEAGVATGAKVQLRWPVQALKEFALDTECRTRVAVAGGQRLTAVEIQRRYLQQAERRCNRRKLPPWAPDVCEAWRDTLDRLEEDGSDAVADRLDWGVKLAVFKAHAERKYGFRWDELKHWSQAARGLIARALHGNHTSAGGENLADAFNLNSVGEGALNEIKTCLESAGTAFSRERMADFFRLRSELSQIDMRFSQIGKGGIFDRLDAVDGLLHHHVPAVTDIAAAKHDPPQDTRAKLRGGCVRDFGGRSGFRCDWHTIQDRCKKRYLDLSDPFATAAQWRVMSEETPPIGEDMIHRILHERRAVRARRRVPATPREVEPPDGNGERSRSLDQELLARILM